MISPYSSALSGIRAAFTMLDVSAHNTANINTDGFKKQKAILSEAPGGGVAASVERVNSSGPSYLDPSGKFIEASNVDYADEAVFQLSARRFMSVNIAALKTADEMQKSLLDIFA